MQTRRDILGATSAVLAGSALGSGIGARAQDKPKTRVPFGACVRPDVLKNEPQYRAALAGYCQQIVPEGSLKWGVIRPVRGQYNFDAADAIAAFARDRKLALRGHTLCWYASLPAWTKDISSAVEAERELVTHIETVVARYKGLIHSWDVVNEPLDENARGAGDHRPSVWHRTLGEDYLRIAFEAARRVDPNLELVLNDYGVESGTAQNKNKREALRGLISRLRDKGVPITAIGLQAHLRGEQPVDHDGVAKLAEHIKSLGLGLLITELDVTDDKLPAAELQRDAICAERVRELLEAVFSVTHPSAVLTWGITDRYTWVPMWFKRKDGLLNRPLPLDADYKPKPMMSVIDQFCREKV
jgi:endo-1,4-beta-xylanase